jgi:phosphoribosylformylglycinamidine synthase subunit PurS
MIDKEAAKARLEEMCEKLLANPVIESYAIEILD